MTLILVCLMAKAWNILYRYSSFTLLFCHSEALQMQFSFIFIMDKVYKSGQCEKSMKIFHFRVNFLFKFNISFHSIKIILTKTNMYSDSKGFCTCTM